MRSLERRIDRMEALQSDECVQCAIAALFADPPTEPPETCRHDRRMTYEQVLAALDEEHEDAAGGQHRQGRI
jgi:hypothetical protein